MNYFLVLLSNTTDSVGDAEADAHERFIDSLIADNAVLLGGPLHGPVSDFTGGYVLAADDGAAAIALAHNDPLIAHGCATCLVAEWRLVGINPAAIDPAQILSP